MRKYSFFSLQATPLNHPVKVTRLWQEWIAKEVSDEGRWWILMVCKGGKRAVGSGEDGKEGNTSLMKERAQERDQVGGKKRTNYLYC